MSLERTVVPASKRTKRRGCVKGTQEPPKSSRWPRLGPYERQQKVLDYNPKYKINTHESIRIQVAAPISKWGGQTTLLCRTPNDSCKCCAPGRRNVNPHSLPMDGSW